jgi:hypothetical protein
MPSAYNRWSTETKAFVEQLLPSQNSSKVERGKALWTVAGVFRPVARMGGVETWNTERGASVCATEAFISAVAVGRHVVGPDPVRRIRFGKNMCGIEAFGFDVWAFWEKE